MARSIILNEKEYRQFKEILRYSRHQPRIEPGVSRRVVAQYYPGGGVTDIRFAYTETPLPAGTIWVDPSANPDSPWAFKPGFGECYLYEMTKNSGTDYVIKAEPKPPDDNGTPVPTPTVTVYNWTQNLVGGEDRLLVISKEKPSREWIVIAEACPPWDDIYLMTEDA